MSCFRTVFVTVFFKSYLEVSSEFFILIENHNLEKCIKRVHNQNKVGMSIRVYLSFQDIFSLVLATS